MFLSEDERRETIRACRYCPMCYVADRVASVIRRESYSPRGRGNILFGLERGFVEWDEKISDIFYTTLNDGLLQGWCVGRYDHEELVIDTRARILERGLAPEGVVAFTNNLKRHWSHGLNPEQLLSSAGVTVSPGAKILLYAGCTVRETEAETLVTTGGFSIR
jgi:Fe-S oxidoreductase